MLMLLKLFLNLFLQTAHHLVNGYSSQISGRFALLISCRTYLYCKFKEIKTILGEVSEVISNQVNRFDISYCNWRNVEH